jgi:hypothetical protein
MPFIATLIAVPLVAIGAIPFIVLNGYAIWVLWSWFIVPFGVQQISIAWAIGLSSLTQLMVPAATPDSSKREWWFPLLVGLVRPGFALLFGYVAKSYM